MLHVGCSNACHLHLPAVLSPKECMTFPTGSEAPHCWLPEVRHGRAGSAPLCHGSMTCTLTGALRMPPGQVHLYDVGSLHGGLSMRAIPLLEEAGAPTPVALQDALPPAAFLAPVAARKEALAAAIEALEPCEPGARNPQVLVACAGTMLTLSGALQACAQDYAAPRTVETPVLICAARVPALIDGH